MSVGEGFLGPSAEDALSMYESTVKSRCPQYDGKSYVSTNGRWMSDETMFLPLTDDTGRVNRVLVFADSKPNTKKRSP
jgi:hypothetical protein